ncbi:hypothetical protein D3C79_863010 [compost metagenome]
MKYSPMPGNRSMTVNSTSRTASAVCITLVVTRPENSSEKNDRLCRSIRRWKSQRRRSGKLIANTWCCTIVRSATSPILVISTMPIPHSTLRSCPAAAPPACQVESRSTTWPRKENNQAS